MNSTIDKIKAFTINVEGRIAPEEAELLYQLARDGEGEGEIVEIGSYHGYSTIWLASASKEKEREKVYAVDPHNDSEGLGHNEHIFRQNMRNALVENYVVPMVATSSEAAKKWNAPIRLLFIDGAHDYENAKNDFLLWERHVVEGGIIVFHDYLSMSCPGVTRVVKDHIFDSDNYLVIGYVNTVVYAKKVDGLSDQEKLIKDSIFQELVPRSRMEDGYQRALALIGESRDSEAIPYLQECEIGIRNFFSPMYRMIRLCAIAGTYQKIDRKDEAERLYKEIAAFEDAPFIEKVAALMNLGNMYRTQNKYQEAACKFREALTIEKISEKNRYNALMGLGRCNTSLNNHGEACEHFRAALRIDGISEKERYETMTGLGRCYFAMKKYQDAENMFRESLKIEGISEKERYEAFMDLGRCNFAEKKYREAEDLFTKASDAGDIEDIKKFHALVSRGRCSTALKKYDGAEEAYNEALSTGSVDAENRLIAVLELGTCYHVQGKYTEEESEYFKVLSYEGVREMEGIWKYRLLNRLGNIFFSHGRLDEAQRQYEDALSLKDIPGNDRYHAVLGLGRCYYISGKYDKAEVLYHEAIAHADISDESKIQIAHALVDCYFAKGNFNRIEDICGKMLLLEDITEQKKRNFIAEVKKKINSLSGLYGGVNA